MPIIIVEEHNSVSCEDLYAEYLIAKAADPTLPPFEVWSANMVCHTDDA